MRVRPSPEQCVAEIADAAKRLRRAAELAAVSVWSLAEAAHVARGQVTHDFPLDEIVALADAALAADESWEMLEALSEMPCPVEKLAAVLASAISEDVAVTLMWVEIRALARQNAQLDLAAREEADAWRRLVSGVVDDGAQVSPHCMVIAC